jgi:HD-like signal output (HDOD) protein/ActR/RegA family two-component response regulator
VKQSILFVDDDTNLLQSFQRLLRSQRDRWDMVFSADPRGALAVVASRRFDVVVSDMRMPSIDGAQFLTEVARLSPASLRVVLSGYAEEASLLRSVGPAHQYLAKPCNSETIIALMDRARKLPWILSDARLRAVTGGLRNLPSPPDLYHQLAEAMAKQDVSTTVLANIISTDIAMTAELLKITNSSYFVVNARVATIGQAIRLLGIETIRALVLTLGIFRQYQGIPKLAKQLALLNNYSLRLGRLAEQLAKEDGACEATQAEANCAGLLSCVGALVLLDNNVTAYEDALTESADIGLENAERAAFSASHAEIGAHLLGLWGFSEAIVEAVFYQLHPADCPSTGRAVLTYLHLARAFGPPFPLGPVPVPPRLVLDLAYASRLGLDAQARRP